MTASFIISLKIKNQYYINHNVKQGSSMVQASDGRQQVLYLDMDSWLE